MRVIIAGRLSRKAADRDQTGFDSQERESVRWAQYHGHEVVAVLADYKTGRSGLEARKNLRPWVTDPAKLAQYDAIVALKVDRLTRGNREETAKLEAWAREQGKQLFISDSDVHFPSEGTDGIQWDMMLRMAHQEWLNTSERYRRMQRTRREQGSMVGRPPWGMKIEKRDGKKLLVPTSEGRKYIPLIYKAVIEGKTIRAIAAWLDSEHVKTPSGGKHWHEAIIARLIKNPTYYGHRPNSGNLETEALVSVSLWQEANAALKSRYRPGRKAIRYEKPLLKPICGACYGEVRPGCPSGKSPMQRIFTGAPANRTAYYRCTGHGPQRKSCGAPMVPCTALDSIVLEARFSDDAPHEDYQFVSGDDVSDQISRLREQGAEAMRKGDYQAATEAGQRASELEDTPRTAPHWERQESDQTEGDYFMGLDPADWREYIATRYEVTAEMGEDGPRAGMVARPLL